MIRRHVVVTGQVQGVFFRASCAEEARRHGVAGWVVNRPDGSVEAVLEGPAEAVEAMIGWTHHGPAQAVVESVDVTTEEPRGIDGFSTR